MGTSVGNLIPNEIKELAGSDVGKLVGGSAGFGVGGATGAAAATGNDVSQAAALDLAGLGAGAGISALSGPSAAGASSGASATGGASTPWMSNAPAGSVFAAPGAPNIAPSAAASDFLTTGGATGAEFPWLSNAPAGSVFAAPSMGANLLTPAASSALNLPNPVTGAARTAPTSSVAAPRAPAIPGSPPPGPGTPPPVTPPPPTGGGFVDNLLKQMKDNALALGLVGGSMLLAGRPQPMPSQAQLEGLSAEAQATANQLLAQYRSGQLNASQQAGLDQLTRQTKNQITQYFASIGQADSTAHQQALAQVDQQALGMRQQMLDNMLNQGLQAIGVASGPLQTVAQYQLGQDQALRQALGNFAGAVGLLFGRNAGTQAPRPQQPQPTGTVTSAQ